MTQTGPTYPFGAHVAVVEVDIETGQVRFVKHVAVDDCGRILNPLLVRGQQHGGIAQGAAQALWEQFVYDEHGNPLTSTLAEYAMPSAAEFPSFDTLNTETPTPLNPLGAKGIGESGTIGSMPAVQNAVIDAVSHLGVRHIEMPCSPEKVWRAIQTAGDGGDTVGWRDPPAVFASLPRAGPAPPACRGRCRDLVLARSRSRCTSRSDLDGRSRAGSTGRAGAARARRPTRPWKRWPRTPSAMPQSPTGPGWRSMPERPITSRWSRSSAVRRARTSAYPSAPRRPTAGG